MLNSRNTRIRNLITDFLHVKSKDIIALFNWIKAFKDSGRPNNSAFYTAKSIFVLAPSQTKNGISGSFENRANPTTGHL